MMMGHPLIFLSFNVPEVRPPGCLGVWQWPGPIHPDDTRPSDDAASRARWQGAEESEVAPNLQLASYAWAFMRHFPADADDNGVWGASLQQKRRCDTGGCSIPC